MQPDSVASDGDDGDTSTFAQATNQYRWQLQVDLQSIRAIDDLAVVQPSTAYATAFHVDVSTNGTTYTTVATLTGTGSGTTFVPLSSATDARYIRVIADQPSAGGETGGQMAISELEVYEG
jgi:hypothetical protein